MHDARRVGAFFSGLFLYIVAIVGAAALAGYHFPHAVELQLGGRGSLNVQILEAALIALVLLLLALVWSFVSLKPASRPVRKSRRLATSWFLSGVGTAWLGGLIYGAFHFALNPRSYQSLASLLLSADTPPLWGLLNIFAVLLGAALALALVRKLNPVAPQRFGLPVQGARTSPA